MLPQDLKDVVTKNVNCLTCSYCKTYRISKFTDCDHGLCSNCYSDVQQSKKCFCGIKFQSEEKSDLMCLLCRQDIDVCEVNCLHYCGVCTQTMIKNNISQCDICNKNIKIIEYEGQCAKCTYYFNDILKICEDHYCCKTCSKIAYKNYKCFCNKSLSEEFSAKMLTIRYLKCFKCKNRVENTSIFRQDCCNKYYCLMCLTTQPEFICFCRNQIDQRLHHQIKQCKIAKSRLTQLFDLIKAGC